MKMYKQKISKSDAIEILEDFLAFRKGSVLRFVDPDNVNKALKYIVNDYRKQNLKNDNVEL